ncbi:PAS domain-containing protein [Candidatus Sumerlaeota bacterium]|nr:PAS domain-containing protein [Candidatus Sumerlaeota bacterium]
MDEAARELRRVMPLEGVEGQPHWDLLAALFYYTPIGLFVIDDQRRIVLYNPAAAELTGWAGEDPIDVGCRVLSGKACPITEGSLFDPGNCPGEEVLLTMRSEVSHEVELFDPKGHRRLIEATYYPIHNPDGTMKFIIGTLRDIEERRHLQDQLVQSKKLASLGTLVAGIAHELRNPLGVIRSAAQILANEERSPLQRREAIRLLLEETGRLDKSIREFLAFARPQAARPEPTDIVAFTKRVLEIRRTAETGGAPIIALETEPGLPRLDIDTDLMRQVFENLIGNAGQARPDSDEPVRIEIRIARDDEDHLRIEFADDGEGIEPEHVTKIFDPFFTTKRDGTGLGLSIVHQIITQHRGRLTVDSERGRGTTFSIQLPISEESRA